jgi:hypothetical protein
MEQKQISPWHGWVFGREMEGTLDQGPEVGVWSITVQRIARGWGILNDEDYPFDKAVWPPRVIKGDLEKAKPNRIWCYQMIRGAKDGCDAIDRNGAFTASFEITDQWFNAEEGVIAYPPKGNVAGGHAVTFFQYSHKIGKFRFANSWGIDWGDRGFGTLSYEFFNDFQLEGYTPYLAPRLPLPYSHDIQFLRFGYIGFAGIPVHICEIYRHADDEIMGWAFAVQRGDHLEIEELYVKPQYRGNGLAGELATLLQAVRREINLPLRAWISHADVSTPSLAAADAVLMKLGLTRQPSPERWAAYVATEPGDTSPMGTTPHAPPARPRQFFLAGGRFDQERG